MEIKPEDLNISSWCSVPKSGFDINTEKGIKIIHKPTGVEVTYERARSQHQNRAKCMDKLRYELILLEGNCKDYNYYYYSVDDRSELPENPSTKFGMALDNTRTSNSLEGKSYVWLLHDGVWSDESVEASDVIPLQEPKTITVTELQEKIKICESEMNKLLSGILSLATYKEFELEFITESLAPPDDPSASKIISVKANIKASV